MKLSRMEIAMPVTDAQRQARRRAKQAADAGSLRKMVAEIRAEVRRLRELLEPTKDDIATRKAKHGQGA
jgi:hypothetical protein